jgi:hypothetical protein
MIEPKHLRHLEDQFAKAYPVLFTGAGFSIGATNQFGKTIPSSTELRDEIWRLCYPGEAPDLYSSLGDVYQHALKINPKGLRALIDTRLTVDSRSLPPWYRNYFALPWESIYTLNIDNLETAVKIKFDLPREICTLSAVQETGIDQRSGTANKLQVIHLNGLITDELDRITFSPPQYGARLNKHQAWHDLFSAQLMSRPVVFIGTRLEEPPLWQYITGRLERSRGESELRPKSYLVSPQLDRAKQSLLDQFNITWIRMTAEEFSTQVLEKLASTSIGEGLTKLLQRPDSTRQLIPLVADIGRVTKITDSEFLLGAEPEWADVKQGRAIHRIVDDEIYNETNSLLRSPASPKSFLLLSGTAGSGKSTSLMQLCLRLSAEGWNVGWVGKGTPLAWRDVVNGVKQDSSIKLLAIDDSDSFGPNLSVLLAKVNGLDQAPLVCVAVRSGSIDHVIKIHELQGLEPLEIPMPPLVDSDIDKLIKILSTENRLGVLKGKSLKEQRELFREQSGRQLLVAMIQATSGKKLEDKAIEELEGLPAEEMLLYALISSATHFRYELNMEELLLACGQIPSNSTMNSIARLVKRHIIRKTDAGRLATRHRLIADIIHDHLANHGRLHRVIEDLSRVAAIRIASNPGANERGIRLLLRRTTNHDTLYKTLGLEASRRLYSNLENLLSNDSHFWLQRGSLEVEFGYLQLAENFLGQAQSLAGTDYLVITECAYLDFRKAIEEPHSSKSDNLVARATSALEAQIETRGRRDYYPFHVLGSQGLSWSRKCQRTLDYRDALLNDLIEAITLGLKFHPGRTELKVLKEDLVRERLNLRVTKTN